MSPTDSCFSLGFKAQTVWQIESLASKSSVTRTSSFPNGWYSESPVLPEALPAIIITTLVFMSLNLSPACPIPLSTWWRLLDRRSSSCSEFCKLFLKVLFFFGFLTLMNEFWSWRGQLINQNSREFQVLWDVWLWEIGRYALDVLFWFLVSRAHWCDWVGTVNESGDLQLCFPGPSGTQADSFFSQPHPSICFAVILPLGL